MEITEFVKEISVLKNTNLIHNYSSFITSLYKLNKLIGMEKVKQTILSQIKYYLINKSRNVHGLDSHMFHTTVLGPPGCGKTTLVEILAEIWVCLGILKDESPKAPEPVITSTDENKTLSETLKIIGENLSFKLKNEKLKKQLINDRIKLNVIKKSLNDIQRKYNLKDLRLQIFNVERLSSSLNKTIKYSFENNTSNCVEKIEDTDYSNVKDTDMIEKSFEGLNEAIEEKFNPLDHIIKLKRNDLIGKYVGHTALKTREALMKGLNKVIFIDEAYELYNNTSESGSDSFGMECLSTILNFMNEYSEKCIIVFAGYEDLLNNTIFRVQPGLKRRVQWSFILEDYTIKQLVDIYEKQLLEKGWILENKPKLVPLFERNKKLFKYGGGDCLRLCLKTKVIYSDWSFQKLIKGDDIDSTISYEMVEEALKLLKYTQENQEKKIDEPPFGMYT
jgi:hypothetical protein